MSLEFVAIDFETANRRPGSPCQVGLALVRDGRVEATWGTLMQPPYGRGWFDPGDRAIAAATPPTRLMIKPAAFVSAASMSMLTRAAFILAGVESDVTGVPVVELHQNTRMQPSAGVSSATPSCFSRFRAR